MKAWAGVLTTLAGSYFSHTFRKKPADGRAGSNADSRKNLPIAILAATAGDFISSNESSKCFELMIAGY